MTFTLYPILVILPIAFAKYYRIIPVAALSIMLANQIKNERDKYINNAFVLLDTALGKVNSLINNKGVISFIRRIVSMSFHLIGLLKSRLNMPMIDFASTMYRPDVRSTSNHIG